MAKKTFNAAVAAILVVFSTVIASCTDANTLDNRKALAGDEVIISKDQAITRKIQHAVDFYQNKGADKMRSTITVSILENGSVVDSYDRNANPEMATSLVVTKNNYTITEDLLNSEVVGNTVIRSYGRSNAVYGYEEVDTVVLDLNDGQQLRCPVSITTPVTEISGKEIAFGTDTLISARLVSAENYETTPATRATYVASAVNTVYSVELTFAEKNTAKDTTFVVVLEGSAIRNILAEDAIAKVEATNKNREILDATTERVSFDKVITMKSGETTTVSKSTVLNREFKGIASYNKTVSSFAYNFEKSNGLKNGSESQVRESEGWTVFGKTDSYSANISNGVAADAIETSYSFYHERASYKDSDVTVDFGYENISVDEVKTSVSNATSDKNGYDKSILNNEVRSLYMNYTQNISENVNLYKVAKAIASQGWDASSAKMVISNGSVVCSVNWLTKYNTGETETETYSKTFARSLKATSNWTAAAENSNQSTGAANVNVKNAAKTDGFWKWNEETRTIVTVATLSGSSQNNSWTSVDPNAIVITREGKSYSFGNTEFSATESGASVNKTAETEEEVTYAYSDKLTVKFGSNSQTTSAPGTIKVAKEVKGDFPAEWGKFVKASCTVAANEEVKDWVYTWSLHFEHGTLPVVVRKNETKTTINQSLYENVVDTRYNGASYVDGAWVNSIASDEANYMIWTSRSSSTYRIVRYSTATMWNWNSGNNTVKSDKFTFSIENGGKVLVVKKDGTTYMTLRASVK